MSTGANDDPTEAGYRELRSQMFGIAYRMLGSAAEAEDIVQDAFIRFHKAIQERAEVESPKAYLSTITTRVAIDHLRKAQTQRETYVGQWLPEPLIEDPEGDVAGHAEMVDSLSIAFLVLLETLSPVQRAVFLLHDIFDYGYEEIASIVGKSEDNCRQLASRARRQIEERRPRYETSAEQQDELARRFFDAIEEGDTDGLVDLLASEAVLNGDGGGKAPSWPQPFVGAREVARVLANTGKAIVSLGLHLRHVTVNGAPGAASVDAKGRLGNVFVLEIGDGAVQRVASIINPEKLRHLGPLIDLAALSKAPRSGPDS